ncbi:MAG: hypothetical protein KatS3mg103_0637 [Phycisphaerales bacterium]|nr:MAG: hypothetical protein KatS3mg103_0637 [Phycisphaerales bacterium]
MRASRPPAKTWTRAHRLFAAGGEVYDLPEPALDAFTAAAGSGPALAFLLAQAMAEGALEAGRQAGLTEALARRIVAQTIRGAAEMLKAEQQGQPADPIALRQRVTSPGGTTAAAVELLEARGVPEALRQAVVAAARRSAELGQGLDAPADGQPPQPE